MRKYVPPKYDRPLQEVLADLASEDEVVLCRALVDLIYSDTDDFEFILNVFFEYIDYDDSWIPKLAVQSIGELFMIYATKDFGILGKETIQELSSLTIDRKDLAVYVKDAISDIEISCKRSR